ncbi:hypothetical protein HN747_01020 [archaeon]|jgi:hypothetical protein|nr:hypothetical protein [archaeon]
MGRDLKYITGRDKLVGFFWPPYIAKREKHVNEQIEQDGGVNALPLSELEKRSGIFSWYGDSVFRVTLDNIRNF